MTDRPLLSMEDVRAMGSDPTSPPSNIDNVQKGSKSTSKAATPEHKTQVVPFVGAGMSAAERYSKFLAAYKTRRPKKGGYVSPPNVAVGGNGITDVVGNLAGTAASYIPVVGPILGSVLKTAIPAVAALIKRHREKKAAARAKATEQSQTVSGGASELPTPDPNSIVMALAGKEGREPKDDLALWRETFRMAKEILLSRFGGTANRNHLIKKYIRRLTKVTFGPMSVAFGDAGVSGKPIEKTADGKATVGAVVKPIISGLVSKAMAAAKSPEVQSAAKSALGWLANAGKEFLGLGITPADSLHGLIARASDELAKGGVPLMAGKLSKLAKRLSGDTVEMITKKGMTPEERDDFMALKLAALRERKRDNAMRRLKKYGLLKRS